jgi:Flp pilus assembly protein TadG
MSPALRAVRARRGVGFLFFVLFTLPCIFLALVLSYDVTRVYLAAKEARGAAAAAADAGAYQFQTNTYTLDQNAAYDEAQATLTESQRLGVTRHARSLRSSINTSSTSVRVELTFNVRGLSPIGALLAGTVVSRDFTVSAVSDICQPGRYNPTGGACTRPEE